MKNKKPVKKKVVAKKTLPKKKPGKKPATVLLKKKAAKPGANRKKATPVKKITVTDSPKVEDNKDDEELELTETYILFSKFYVEQGCQNGAKAAIRAGYSEKTARFQASRLLTNDNITAYIEVLKKNVGIVIDVSIYDIAREYKKIGFINPKVFYNLDGSTKNIHDIPDEAAAAIASIEVEELFEYIGKDVGKVQVGVIKKIKLHSKTTGLDSLAKMMGADGVTKVANVNKDGEDVPQTLSDKHVVALLAEIRAAAGLKK